MFTGIVEGLDEVLDIAKRDDDAVLRIGSPTLLGAAREGDSIAVNGVCLTVTDLSDKAFSADIMGETLRRTALSDLALGDMVNLERSLPVGGRFGGHVVQGHVDGVGRVVERTPHDAWETMKFAVPAQMSRYLVAKGSVAVDGISLTVVDAGDGDFSVGLIPTTLARTTLGRRVPGDRVNLEVDIMAKYVERLMKYGEGE